MKITSILLGTAVAVQAQTVTVTIPSQADHRYLIEANTDLQSQFWQPSAWLAGDGTLLQTNMPMTGSSGFYRVTDMPVGAFWFNWHWRTPDTLNAWGLGTSETAHVRSDHPWPWYVGQYDGSPDQDNNCGPACAAMALNWYFGGTNTGAYTRTYTPGKDGWWGTSDIYHLLLSSNVPVNFGTADLTSMTNALNGGHLLILCINVSYLTPDYSNVLRYGRYYNGTGHFIIIKGYRITDAGLWFEAYDPINGLFYEDVPEELGYDRHHDSTSLLLAMTKWWAYFWDVSPPDAVAPMRASVQDITSLPVAYGK